MRHAKPWFRAALNAWYVEHHGKQICLGKHPDSAATPKKTATGWNAPKDILDAFYKLMATDPANLPQADRLAVRVLCDLFLEHSRTHHAPDTYANYKHFLQTFCDSYGTVMAAEVKPFHVSKWLDTNSGWKAGRRHAVIAVKRAFSWADQQGVLSPSPLKTLKAGRPTKRTRVLSPDEIGQILAAVRDQSFKRFLRAMIETGCRPSEVSRVTAANVDLAAGVWRLPEHKTAKKTHKPRVVFLVPSVLELSRELMTVNPDGPLFRGPRRNSPYTRQAIRCRFRRLRAKLPHLKHFTCYALRHSFATHALVNGVGIAQVAELLGHTSTEMVSSTYGHLAEQTKHMREAAVKAVGG